MCYINNGVCDYMNKQFLSIVLYELNNSEMQVTFYD